ncbi:hypothetical protein [Flavobacterium algicola]|uniref:hypothetical protein n=1 Tax=Flavobacterium algicola TaxID=556529 RepID=UPI001EFDB41C|nr:hypothetical protein [Flavobacterium algicola]MCG9791026.1 hypothetical protein [Flavobacterium algicola]
MKNIILGIFIGLTASFLILNRIPWSEFFSITVLKAGFTVFLALIGGLIALYQVKANVISSARIKWIEEFKTNIAEYTSMTNEVIFSFREHFESKDLDHRSLYHQKYMDVSHKVAIVRGKIYLNLNLDEKPYKSICNIMTNIEKLTLHTNLENICQEENYDEISDLFNDLNSATFKAMKIEWEKSKKLINFN